MRMIEIGKMFPDANITWIQIRQYDFGFGPAKIPGQWRDFRVDKVDYEGQILQEDMKKLMWYSSAPVNLKRPYDLHGIKHFVEILRKSHVNCIGFYNSNKFKTLQMYRRFDLIVIDHVFQECFEVISSLFNTTTIRFSGWPISDGYITPMNLPAPPSYVPKYSTPFPGTGLNFFERVQNSIFHGLIVFARIMQTLALNIYCGYEGLNDVDLFDVESKHVFYIGGLEFLLEPIRPINNRIKHFGCSSCHEKLDESKDSKQASWAHKLSNDSIQVLMENEPFVLVTFGSLMKIKEMPERLLNTFLRTFSRMNKTVIWQANTDIGWIRAKRSIPYNVHFVRWLPMKRVFGRPLWYEKAYFLVHKNLQYVISLAGSNTVNELMSYGVPILGIPLHSDQTSNMQKLVELGVGTMVVRDDLWNNDLYQKIIDFEIKYAHFKLRASKVSSMIESHRELYGNHEKFWLEWSIRNGEKLKKNKRFFEFFYRSSRNYFLADEVIVLSLVCVIFVCILKK